MTGDLFPGRAAVSGFVKSATWASDRRVGVVGRPSRIPERSIDRSRVVRIVSEINRTGVFVFVEDTGPGFAAIGRAIHTALRVWTKAMTECGDQYNIRIFRID